MSWRRSVAGALVCALTWLAGYYVTKFVAGHAEARVVYGLIAGWWLTAYVCSKLSIPLMSAVVFAIGYWVVFLAAAVMGSAWFYRDTLSVTDALFVGLVQSFLVASPILFNKAVEFLVGCFSESTGLTLRR
jgi:hypothetical protein